MSCLERHTSGRVGNFVRAISLALMVSVCNLNWLHAQISPELGQLDLHNYTTKDYKASPQNWAISQDIQGVMYFGNSLGVLVYDGVSWQIVKSSNESFIRSLDVSPMGTIYVGGVGDFGYIESDENGKHAFFSLQKHFNLKEEEIEDVYCVNAFDEGVYFMTNRRIYFYNGKSLKIWESESLFQSAYNINGKYIVNQLSTGLCELIGDSVMPLSEVNDFKNTKIYDIVPHGENEMLVLTEKRGIYHFYRKSDDEGVDEDYRVKINTNVKDYFPNNGIYLNKKFMSIGTWGYGVILVDENGDIVQQINSDMGLNDEVINDQFVDREGNLWLAMSNGITKISLNHSFSTFAEKANVHETVEAVEEFDDKIFIATHTGLFYLDKNKASSVFEKVKGLNEEVWGLMRYYNGSEEVLLIAENNAVYELNANMKLTNIVKCYPWTFYRLKNDPSVVFVGLDDGVICLKYNGGNWKAMDKIEGVDFTINSFAENGDDELWLGGPDRAVRLNIERSRSIGGDRFVIQEYGAEHGLPEGDIYISEGNDGLIFGTSAGIFSYEIESDSFKVREDFQSAFGDGNFLVHRLSLNKDGRIWMSAYEENDFFLGFFELVGDHYRWEYKEFLPFSEEVYHSIYHDEDYYTWLGGPVGLMRYSNKNTSLIADQSFEVKLSGVMLNNDSMNYFGCHPVLNYGDSAIAQRERVSYSYNYNSICFSFSSQYFKYPSMNEYSYQLEGFSDKWSDWSKDPKAIFTNLHEGYYKFRVKARNAYKHESSVAEYSFKIQAPWYRAWWAYFIYLLVASLLIYSIVSMYTQRLKEIIKEKTAEVVAQKNEIERQKDEVEHQRHELEIKNADITSSINYARRLQRAILPEDAMIKKYLPEAFILYKPKDIVSGDFYWMDHVNGVPGRDITLFAAVDCTGHGVPGAFVSVVGNGGLNRAVNEFGLVEPASILEKLNEIVVETLSKGESEVRDGMDISLCSFDFRKMEMQFAGANNGAYLVRKGVAEADIGLNGNGRYHKEDLVEIKPNKQPVGYYEFREAFVNNTIKVEKGDVIYLFSDGFADQFGGPKGKKYNYPRFKDFLVSISDKPMEEQKSMVEKEFESWRGTEEQIDDVIVAGIRI